MIIKFILIFGLLLCLFYAYLQRTKSRLVACAIFLTAAVGIYFVIFPEQTTNIAEFLGVGRGADLILYCWLIISLVISMNLQFKILELQEVVTELTRELAIREPIKPTHPVAQHSALPQASE